MPYRGRDDFSKALDPIALYEIGTSIQAASAYLEDNSFMSIFSGLAEDFDEYVESGAIDSANRTAISKFLERADKYYDEAQSLKGYYDYYSLDASRPVPWGGWSLANAPSHPEICNGREGTDITGGGGDVIFHCPTSSEMDKHAADEVLLPKLLLAAVQNLRCAQEATYTVAFYNLNRAKAGKGFVSADIPSRITRKHRFRPFAPPAAELDTEAEAPVIEDPAPEKPPAKKKKKGISGFFLFSAVATLFLLKK